MAEEKEINSAFVEGNDHVTGHIISTTIGGKNGEPKQTISYMAERVVGTGSFGIVFQAKCLESGETVAIKKVLQDRRYKNRELQLMRTMDHSNVVSLRHCFFSTTAKNELFLNLVMEYVPETVYRVLRHYSNVNQRMPLIYVKLYTYQIFRGLAYIHTVHGVSHRDVKPQNILVDPLTHQVKLCDFRSAKVLVKGEANISYICSRYYRAPKLIFGATEYTTSIDISSAGCVLAELLLGQPLFPGESAVDQLVEIIKVLGTPTREKIRCMNPNYTEFRFPQIKAHPWHKLFEIELDNSEVDLRYSSALVQGATNVFWIDIQTNTRRFFSLFCYLLEDVALVPTRLSKITTQAQRDLYLLLSRFILFYNLADQLDTFLNHFLPFPNAFLLGSPSDIFVIELTDQLQKLKVEPVLLHYLSQVKVLQGFELRMTTSTRLKACLYSFTSPGGPMYPTRIVRHAAWEALDFLFPVGRYPRHLISLFFRLLYPWYWPSSCWNFVMSCISAVFYSVLRLIFSSWESPGRPKNHHT